MQTVGNSGRPPQSGRMASIAPITKFSRKGSALMVDGKSFCDIGDSTTAHKLVVLLNKIKGFDEVSRARAICDFWKTRIGVRNAKKSIRMAMTASRDMRLFCSLVFIVTFAVLPLISIRFGIGLTVLLGAGILLLSALIICRLFFSCHSLTSL